jgi:hypothetical protein
MRYLWHQQSSSRELAFFMLPRFDHLIMDYPLLVIFHTNYPKFFIWSKYKIHFKACKGKSY